jgi:tripartite-type tricarboxylate transporter receptor subunit TctC
MIWWSASPPAAEAGAPGFDAPFYLVLFTSARVPPAIVARMSVETAKALEAPEVKDRAAAMDVVTVGGSPEDARKVLKEAAAKWAPVVQRIGLKLD